MEYTKSKIWTFSLLVGYPIFKHLLNIRIYNTQNLLKNKPAVIAPNHQNNWDPPIVGYSINPDECFFLAKDDLFKIHPIYSKILSIYNTIKLKREKRDIKAIRIALSKLKENYKLIVFPEGTRKRENKLENIKAGAAFLSLKAEVPLIPCCIKYSSQKFIDIIKGRMNVKVFFGKPIYPPNVKTSLSKKASIMANIWKKEMEILWKLK